MAFLTELWLPILLSAVFVFVASSVIHMLLPIHKSDHRPLKDEARVLDALRPSSPSPGQYMFPWCTSMKDMGSPEYLEKVNRGPVGFMTVLPNGPMAIGRQLMQWFAYCVVTSIFVAYVASFAHAGTDYMSVFRLTGTVGFLGYGLGAVIDSIWKAVPWTTSFKFLFDGLVYALVTAGTFGWLWPAG